MFGYPDVTLRTMEQAFVKWLAAARSRLEIAVEVRARDRRQIELSFIGINSAIGASLTIRQLNIFVEWEGQNWDTLLSLDVWPGLAVGGYICEHCRPEQRTTFPALEALWRDHLFEPLLEWTNGKLSAADAVGLYGSSSKGWTYAKLLSSGDLQSTAPNIRIPLRVS